MTSRQRAFFVVLFTLALAARTVALAGPPKFVIETVAGSGQLGDLTAASGQALDMRVDQPFGVECGPDGALYITSIGAHRVLRLDLKSRELTSVADIGNHRIRRIDTQTGMITSIAGDGQKKLPPDGSHAQGQPIFGPRALHFVGRTMWIALREGNSVWRLDLDSGVIRHVAGTGKSGYSGDGGPPRAATFAGPKGIAATSDGLVYVVDTENQVVRIIDTQADRIHTVGGSGPNARGFAGATGPALRAKFDRPHGICVAPDGSAFLGDTNNHRVRWLHP